jgi:hypothetical protein
MVKAAKSSVPLSVEDVLNSLRIQGIAFRGPFCTPAKHAVFVVESYVLLESELVELLMQNKLNRDGIRAHSKRIQAANSNVDLLIARNPTE